MTSGKRLRNLVRWIVPDGGEGPEAHEAVDRKIDTVVMGKKPGPSATDIDYAAERARLVALNNALIAKGCRAFDLEAELKPEKGSAMPALLPAKK